MRRHHLILMGVTLAVAGCARDSVSPRVQTPGEEGGASRATYTVGSVTALQNAIKNALPGDVILVQPGTYTGVKSTSGYSNAYFYSGKSGTSTSKIILRSQDPANPAILQGSSTSSGYALYLTGDYWEVRDLKFRTASKGIMLDNANRNLLNNVEVSNTGEEGVHFRDGSSNNVIENSRVHHTGVVTDAYGEGIYVGSDAGKWSTYAKETNDNVVRNNILGPAVTAEHVDIKEGASRTILEYNTFHGDGITGANSADSFVDAKGNNSIIRYNTGYREGDTNVVDAFQVHAPVTGWGLNNDFHHNTVYMDNSTPYVVNAPTGTALVSANTRSPSGNMYRGRYTVY